MKSRQSGFTLVELFIVLAIAGVLMAFALPAFVSTIRNNRLSAQTNEFQYTLKYARAEAIKTGVPVTVCRSAAQAACDTGGSDGWEKGWIVFAENTGTLGTLNTSTVTVANGTTLTTPITRSSDGRVFATGTTLTADVVAAAEPILMSHEALTGKFTLRGNNNVANAITFNSQGMVQASNGTVVLCDSRGGTVAAYDAREIIIPFAGHSRVRTPHQRHTSSPAIADPSCP